MTKGSYYPGIDLAGTGIHLKNLIKEKGYTVKDIQHMLNLSCPQPVYRWFKGQILPSVDHLFALSKILYVHMEDLLLPRQTLAEWLKEYKRPLIYWLYVERQHPACPIPPSGCHPST